MHELAGYAMGQLRVQASQVLGYKGNYVDATLMGTES